MSDAKKNGGNNAGRKRNLPSWMSDRDDTETSASASNSGAKDFSKLMEGVVIVLSGFVNPERGGLRSQALEMGAAYQPDWNSSCTLLVCAFPNTPKFRQVEADSGTIVSKEWVSECHKQRKLVEIEPYLMHAGKPWKRQTVTLETSQDKKSSSRKSQKQVEKSSNSKPTSSASSKDVPSSRANDLFSASKVKQWAVDDFNRTLSWLENQDEKPEASEIRKIAAEGILTCLQDTIDTLKQEQSIQQITEQWACLPRAVEELAKINISSQDDLASLSKKDLCKYAIAVIICLLLNIGAADLPSRSGGGGGGGATVSDQSGSCTGYSDGVKVAHTLPLPTNGSTNITIAAAWSSFVMPFLAFFLCFVCLLSHQKMICLAICLLY